MRSRSGVRLSASPSEDSRWTNALVSRVALDGKDAEP
jgi:hypothetical protein